MEFKSILTSYVSAGIPLIHQNSHLVNFEDHYASIESGFYRKIERTTDTLLTLDLKKNKRYVFLCGTPGSGKTHYLVGLYRAMVQKLGYAQGDGVLFTTFPNLASEIIGNFKDDIPMRTALAGYTQAKFLLIDDFTSSERVFKENSLEFNMFRDILLNRYETETTLVTSANLNAPDLLTELDRLFGGYVTSRLSCSEIVQFPELDLRRSKK